ncbi:MAG: hypothetical protein KatS3mg082_2922 [Nitrospiraceae bacterium]|nr:MAG: hypothetical protein KatS3mg081_2447 [Gemmatimonadales bacterium]GIW56518.1 MAG: hypothetical protein KatS3mg082_2922 [Nitrospiraceae bacterium]
MPEKSRDQLGEELPERWSAQRKMEVVLPPLRGEDLRELSREIQLPASELEGRTRASLEGGLNGLKRPDPVCTGECQN